MLINRLLAKIKFNAVYVYATATIFGGVLGFLFSRYIVTIILTSALSVLASPGHFFFFDSLPQNIKTAVTHSGVPGDFDVALCAQDNLPLAVSNRRIQSTGCQELSNSWFPEGKNVFKFQINSLSPPVTLYVLWSLWPSLIAAFGFVCATMAMTFILIFQVSKKMKHENEVLMISQLGHLGLYPVHGGMLSVRIC